MSEYTHVEKPFLDQLAALGWHVIDQGNGIPSDPAQSLRTSFREVALKETFTQSVRAINPLPDGRPWLTDKQLGDLLDEITSLSGRTLVEANEAVLKLLVRATVDVNEATGEQFPEVRLVDWSDPTKNHFLAINQFRINTPGQVRDFICPDIVLFVNGLPWAVIECKQAGPVAANPMHEAFEQLMRYSDQREETRTAGLREGEPRLFYTNQLLIRTSGDEADFGSITSTEEEYFFTWRDIQPEQYRTYSPPLGTERQQEVLIQGMLPPATLLDIVRSCTVFMDVGPVRAKVVCRYQQYRAVGKVMERLRSGQTPRDRSGVVWHTQGSGKSLTMVFAVRKLRTCDDLKDYKVVMVNDRTDLEDQLTDTARLTGEAVTVIDGTKSLKQKLATGSSNLNMVMIHKFKEDDERDVPDYVRRALKGNEPVPQYQPFGVVNSSDRILVMVDEAHRTQSSDLGLNLFEAFPNATKLAFTGTPLIAERHAKKTWERFGTYIDKYRLKDAVDDGVTVQILYEGKTADTAIRDKHDFDTKFENAAAEQVRKQLEKPEQVQRFHREAERQAGGDHERAKALFEDLFRQRSDDEILAIKKKYGATGDLLEAERRIEAIATDLVGHYVENILPNGFKAQVVCHSKMAAIHYKTYIDKALARRIEEERAKPSPDQELIDRISFLKSVVVISSDGTNEKAVITDARRHAASVNAIDSFKRKFAFCDPARANTGIAFLIVCDMLLTGFDAPVEQVMYLDKRITEHNLLQAIARVNRVSRGKSRGYVVDYIGIARHLREALSMYAGSEDEQDVMDSLKDITHELPVLEQRYRRLLHLFADNGVAGIEAFVMQEIADPLQEHGVLERAVELLEVTRHRADFEVYFKAMMQSLDIILPNTSADPYKVPAKRFGYILAQTKERYKDDSLDLSGAGAKVKKLVNEHLISLGINPKIPPIELLSPKFVKELGRHTSAKAKASEMEHAIRKHCKIHFEEDPAFYRKLSEKLDALIQKQREDWDQLVRDLDGLRGEAQAGRRMSIDGITPQEAPFHDLIAQTAFGGGVPDEHAEAVRKLVRELIGVLRSTIGMVSFWDNGYEVGRLKGRLSDLLLYSGVDAVIDKQDKVVTEVTALAKARHRDVLKAS